MSQIEKTNINIDPHNPDFYKFVQEQNENDLARQQNCKDILKTLRLTAAELEVETAAMHLDELWLNIEELKITLQQSTQTKMQN